MKNKKKFIILGITAVILVAAVLISVFVINKKERSVQTTTETTTETSFQKPNEPVFLTGSATPSGSCGEDAMWTYDRENKRLEITGEGIIDDSGEWESFADEVKSVGVEKGITDFEIDVFNSLINAEEFYFSSTVSDETREEFLKSDYYLNRAGRENGVLYRDGVLVDVDPSVSGVFKVKDGTTEIGDNAFDDTEVTKVIIPDSVKKLGYCVFARCYDLEELVIGSGVEQANASYLFAPEGTEVHYAFGAPALKKITVSSSNKNYSSVDGILYNKNKTILYHYPAAKEESEFTIPNSVTSVSGFAFATVPALEKVFIGKNVKTLEKFSMFYCVIEHESEIELNFDIYYEGTKAQWQKLCEGDFYVFETSINVYYNSKPFAEVTTTAKKPTNYKEAYNQYLKNYNGGSYGEHFHFELVYFNNDDIPELFVSEENAHIGSVKILTYTNGKVVQIYEGGKYGTLNYIERNSIVVESDLHQGIVTGYVKRIGDDGTVDVIFSHTDNLGAVPEGSKDVYYMIGGEKVSKFVYEMEVFRMMPEDTSEFCDGIPMTTENIDKYCK